MMPLSRYVLSLRMVIHSVVNDSQLDIDVENVWLMLQCQIALQ